MIEWPWFDYTPEVLACEEALYEHGWVVPFDWSAWQADRGAP